MGGIGSIGYNPDKADVVDTDYQTASVAVSTSQVEAKAGGTPLESRLILTLYNSGSKTIYYGPSGVTSSSGTPLRKKQFASIPVGPNISVYMITDSGSADVIVQEYA
jgi:hypothetical protein